MRAPSGLGVTQCWRTNKYRVVAHRFSFARLRRGIPDGDIERASLIFIEMQLAKSGVGMGYAAQK